jgi:hypothetical protein
MARWLLVRRRRDGELAFYACSGPASTSLVGLVRVAGIRWAVEERFQTGQRRGRPGPLPGPPLPGLVPARHLVDAGPGVPGRHPHPGHRRPRKGGRGGLTSQLGLLPLTVPEVRRLLVALVWTTPIQAGLVLAWSRWRRRHQARARRAHYQRREQQERLEYWCSVPEVSFRFGGSGVGALRSRSGSWLRRDRYHRRRSRCNARAHAPRPVWSGSPSTILIRPPMPLHRPVGGQRSHPAAGS